MSFIDTLMERGSAEEAEALKGGHFFAPGLFVRELRLPAGSAALTHRHRDDHLSILAKGEATLETPEGLTHFTAPAVVLVKAHTDHAIYATSDVVWYCVHATDKTTPGEVDEVVICSGNCRACGGH